MAKGISSGGSSLRSLVRKNTKPAAQMIIIIIAMKSPMVRYVIVDLIKSYSINYSFREMNVKISVGLHFYENFTLFQYHQPKINQLRKISVKNNCWQLFFEYFQSNSNDCKKKTDHKPGNKILNRNRAVQPGPVT